MKNALSKITLLLLVVATMLFAGCAPLVTAAKKGDTKEMERLIAGGADVNATDKHNNAALHEAAWGGHAEVVRLLIEKGADVNLKGNNGNTPLMYAANKDIARLLIEKGADMDAALYKLETDYAYYTNPNLKSSLRGRIAMLNELKKIAKADPINPAEEAAFTEAAAKYRAAFVKPTLTEEARRFKVQAESAVGKKEFEGAASRYKEALAVAPWWPEGRFNRALILGELSRYSDAIKEMKRYLTLVPDAPNARAAQDKIYQWEGELK